MESIISDYFSNGNKGAIEEEAFFVSCQTLEQAISYAGLARNSKYKFPHQYRVKNEALEGSRMVLLQSIGRIQVCESFHQLFLLVESLIGPINGIGPLTIYDTAFRIGIKLGLFPEYIYLHAGTKEGARNLGLYTNEPYLEICQVPNTFQKLKSSEIENIFCIYKDRFKVNGVVRSRC